VNANWVSDGEGEDGRFELKLVTEDGERHVLSPSVAAMPALLALIAADPALYWDPDNETLIATALTGPGRAGPGV
jgi:hypothetical protein